MTYRIINDDNTLSPCPNEVWHTRESAEEGLAYWQAQHPEMKLRIVEERREPE